jgi:hypothetical protein
MNKRNLTALILLLLVAGIVFLLLRRTPQSSEVVDANRQSPSPKRVSELEAATNKIGLAVPNAISTSSQVAVVKPADPSLSWETPINFYGKAVDEMNAALADADVVIYWGNADGEEQKTTLRTDARGLFSLNGAKGRSINVHVAKNGYYTLKSQTRFMYADADDRHFHRPNPDAPAIFRLQRKGQAEPLITARKSARILRDGTPVYLNLLQGTVGSAEQGHIKLECWTNDGEMDLNKRYDWRCLVTVLGGGLLVTTNQFDFLAPENGYLTTDKIEMLKTMDAGWRSEVQKNYFLKLKSGTYARMRFLIIAGGDHFFEVQSFVNPSGSRNLEFDPAVQPKQTQFE